MTAVALALLQTGSPGGVLPTVATDYWPILLRAGWFLGTFLAIAVVGWFVVEPTLSRAVRRRNRNNPTLQEAISRYVRLVAVVVALIVASAAAGYGQLLTDSALVVAAATLALGVAGQTVIGSLISGLVLVVDPEFNVGNYIEWADGQGTVRSITLRVTRVQTPDGELVTIPNTVLTEQAIRRPFGRGRYRVVEQIGVAYEDDVDEAIDVLAGAARSVEAIQAEPDPSVYVDEFGGDAVQLTVHYWIADPRREDVYRVRSAFARAAKPRLDAAGVTISPASKRQLQGRVEVAEPT